MMTISNPLLDFAIGMIAFFLTASLLVTALQETIAQWLDLRAKDLRKKIGEMLEAGDGTGPEATKFFNHPLVAALSTRGEKGGPSYIPSDVFTKAVKDLYLIGQAGDAVIETARGLREDGSPIERALRTLATQTKDDLAAFDKAVGAWFDGVMDRLSGFYKRRVQWILFLLGLCVAVLGNLDTLKVGGFLAGTPAARASLSADLQKRAEEFANTNADDKNQRAKLKEQMNAALEAAQAPMGWNSTAAPKLVMAEMFLAVVGWLLTALTAIIGAPFWFDTLKRFVNIRAAGPLRKSTG